VTRETVLRAYADKVYNSIPTPGRGVRMIHQSIGNGCRLAAFFRQGGDKRARRAALVQAVQGARALRTGARLARMFDAVEVVG
jgi:hypothetical protein